jgi:hypothetical protein
LSGSSSGGGPPGKGAGRGCWLNFMVRVPFQNKSDRRAVISRLASAVSCEVLTH